MLRREERAHQRTGRVKTHRSRNASTTIGPPSEADVPLEMNGESYRLAHSKRRVQRSKSDIPQDNVSQK